MCNKVDGGIIGVSIPLNHVAEARLDRILDKRIHFIFCHPLPLSHQLLKKWIYTVKSSGFLCRELRMQLCGNLQSPECVNETTQVVQPTLRTSQASEAIFHSSADILKCIHFLPFRNGAISSSLSTKIQNWSIACIITSQSLGRRYSQLSTYLFHARRRD